MTRYVWIGVVAFSVMAFREANSGQPPPARTGAPFDNGSCGSCHSGGGPAPTITLLMNGTPVSSTTPYQPGGSAVNMEVRVAHSSASKGGFEVTVATLPSTNDPTPSNGLTAGTGTTILTLGGRSYIGHQGARSFSGGTVSWTFTWTPPASDLGTLRWYVAANAANGDGTTSGDATATATFDMPADLSNSLNSLGHPHTALYHYDPLSQTLTLTGAERAEIFTLEGRLVRTFLGKGPHEMEDLHGSYLLRLYGEGEMKTIRLWLP